MSFFTDIQKVATDTLKKYGETVVLKHKNVGEYNPAKGSAITGFTTQNVIGVPTLRTAREIDGTLIQRGDIKLMVSAIGITAPEVNDMAEIGENIYTITEVRDEKHQGVSVYFDCNLRGE